MPPEPTTTSPAPSGKTYLALVADALEANPALVAHARATIAHWLTLGQSAAEPLRQWDRLLEAAQEQPAVLAEVLAILRSDDAERAKWRDHAPFAAIIPDEVRMQAIDLRGFRPFTN